MFMRFIMFMGFKDMMNALCQNMMSLYKLGFER